MSRLSLFVFFRELQSSGPANPDEILAIEALLRDIPGLSAAMIYTPAPLDEQQPYSADGPPPPLALQLDFGDIALLEAALMRNGRLHELNDPERFPRLSGSRVEHQVMLARPFRVLQTKASACTFLVAYPGPALNLPDWLAYYLRSHTAIMLKFPGLRALDVYSRVDWTSELPWRRMDAIQRNKVVFDDLRALSAALASSVLEELREDVRHAPPVEGSSVHYPMQTRYINHSS